MEFFTSFQFIATVVMAVVALGAYIGLRVVTKKHLKDPEYVKRMEELKRREEEELREKSKAYDEELAAEYDAYDEYDEDIDNGEVNEQ